MDDRAVSGTIADPVLTPDEAFEVGCIAVKNRFPLMFIGGPGVGKTSLWHQIAKAVGCGIKVAHPVVDSPIDYKGQPYAWMEEVKKGKTVTQQPKATFIPYADLEILINAKELLVYIADDLGQATDVVKAAWMQLMLARHINGHPISDYVVFAACSNRKEDAAGVTRFLEPLKDRFHSIFTVRPDFESWRKWALKNGIAHEVIDWARNNAKYLDAFKPSSDFSRTCTPRAIEQLSDWYKTGLPDSVFLRTIAGNVGPEAAVSFMTHLKYYSRIPDPDLVLASPETVKIPGRDEPILTYALIGALVSRASKKTVEAIIKFANRLEREERGEMGTLLVKDAIMRNNDIKGNRAYIDWVADHQEELGL